jgi:hypothetical protein
VEADLGTVVVEVGTGFESWTALCARLDLSCTKQKHQSLSPSSVADPGCLSRIPDPDFYPSRIPDPGSGIPDPKTATKERGENFFFCQTFFFSSKFHKM